MHTLFISDLHLDPQRPEILALFARFLDALDPARTEALYILGDLFEAWIGDDEDEPAYQAISDRLRRVSERGIALNIMHGNRDFLLGPAFAERSSADLIDDPARIGLYGIPTLLMHGDTLCTDDLEYQAFRRQVRDPDWQRQFLALPLAERRRMAAGLRETSRVQTASKRPGIMDVNPEVIMKAMREAGVQTLIHGHTHRPGVHEFDLDGRPARRIVLGDWYDQGSVLEVSEAGPELRSLQP
ncbi:MAG TPA: UDP-2,3-diacylglucosamine diphosphatase [Thiohalobacter sp.]|nr:UDP-2,3-diacylglucosamine diphosphatase [Thiohalobacter sp.]